MHYDSFKKPKDNPGALVNTDHEALRNYKEQRNRLRQLTSQVEEINTIKQEVNEIKSKMDSIESLLLKVLETK